MRNQKTLKFVFSSLFVLLLFSFTLKSDRIQAPENEIFSSFLQTVCDQYVTEVDNASLLKKAMQSICSSLDQYTAFYDSLETIKRAEHWKGLQYCGIGVNLFNDNGLVVVDGVTENGPADIAGIIPGDIITSVGGKEVAALSFSETMNLLRGDSGIGVKVNVNRGNELLHFDIERTPLYSPAIEYAGFPEKGLFYIRLSHFLQGSADSLRNCIAVARKTAKIDSIVIDLRANSGGLVQEAVDVLSMFLPTGTRVCETRGRYPWSNTSYQTKNESPDTVTPLFLITDGKTISAAEIFAGAIQDLDRGLIFGTSTFGKGIVQGTRFLAHGASLYLTVAHYYTPSDRCIHRTSMQDQDKQKVFYTKKGRVVKAGGGVFPDIQVDEGKTIPEIQYLQQSRAFFRYAVVLARQPDNYKNPGDVLITNQQVDQFLKFLTTDKQAVFSSDHSSLMSTFNNMEPGNRKLLQPEFDKMEQKIRREAIKALSGNKQQLKNAIGAELVRQLFHESGRIGYMIFDEPYVRKIAIIRK
ncbi:MAG: PDZ domain-containing protein [Bacteroidetes bacterium]|nr:PDZ domain-containing protein [Bacteroidota bacterium]MBU1719295.1 PDZ domain-containing protein [Bacteroidota bacterium]